MISYEEAQKLITEHIAPFKTTKLPVWEAEGFVLAEDTYARIDVPSVSVSLKDGFAVRAEDVANASQETPVRLKLLGEIFAGGEKGLVLKPKTCIRITAGAPVPESASAVLAEEFARADGDTVLAFADAPPGKNILPRGQDLTKGKPLLPKGTLLFPPEVGLLAGAGFGEVEVFAKPKVHILATGDEVVAPGQPLSEGKIYASNLVTLCSWCRHFGLATTYAVEKDEEGVIRAHMEKSLAETDVLITSGGAWKGPKDLVHRVLKALGWEEIFHYVRIGPGKAVSFGKLGKKIIFCLPGGPPSNQMAFLNLALPGILRLAGWQNGPFPWVFAKLTQSLSGQEDWTQFFLGKVFIEKDEMWFEPLPPKSRLSYLANAEALATLPEGKTSLEEGETIKIKLLKFPLNESRY